MRWRSYGWVVLAAFATVSGSGCGQSGLVKVQGKITFNGKPVEGAMVQFLPDGGAKQPATGVTESDGSFELSTVRPGDGAWPGEYKVLVTRAEMDPALTRQVDQSDPKQVAEQYGKGMALLAKPKKWLLPAVYGDPSTTPLRWKVPDDNKRTLELTGAR